MTQTILRSLIFNVLENIENALRTKFAYYFSHRYGPSTYIDPQNISCNFEHREWNDKLMESIKRGHEEFIKNFYSVYKEEDYLTLWIAIEIIYFGQLSILFKGLMRRDRKKFLEDCFGIDEKRFILWVYILVYIRNLCAHHCRIWDRTFFIRPKIPRELNEQIGFSNSKTFCVFMMFINYTRSMGNIYKQFITTIIMGTNSR